MEVAESGGEGSGALATSGPGHSNDPTKLCLKSEFLGGQSLRSMDAPQAGAT